MDIEGEALKPSRKNLLDLAQNAGLSHAKSEAVLDEILEVTQRSGGLIGQYPVRKKTLLGIEKVLEQNRTLLEG